MKYLIFLIPVFCFAEYRVDVVRSNGKSASVTFKTEEEALLWLEENKSNKSWGRLETIVPLSEVEDESSCSKIIKGKERSTVDEVIAFFSGEEEEAGEDKCVLPQNFSYSIVDITEEEEAKREAKEQKEQEKSAELDYLKSLKPEIDKSNKPDWEKRLLKKIIEGLK